MFRFSILLLVMFASINALDTPSGNNSQGVQALQNTFSLKNSTITFSINKPGMRFSCDGVISGNDAVAFAKNYSYATPNGTTAVQNGTWSGTIYQNTGNYYNINFKIKVPTPLPPVGKHLRIVLTWDSSPSLTSDSLGNELADLDLVVPGFYCPGKGVNNENWGSYESNVEVADIARNLITAGSTISPFIRVWPFTIPGVAYNKSLNGIYYTIAWTWVKDQAI